MLRNIRILSQFGIFDNGVKADQSISVKFNNVDLLEFFRADPYLV
jgi:hypothetical protein